MGRAAFCLVALALAGCTMAPRYERPASPVPPSWPVGDAYLRQSETALPSITYEQVFTDPNLQQLIATALANNRDLRIAASNIEVARNQYRVQRAALLPQVDATGLYSSTQTGSGTTSTTGVPVSSVGSTTTHFYSASIGTTAFEIDLFGRIRSLTTAALDRYFATEAAARATRLALVSDIAQAWLSYAADQSLKAIAEDTAESARKSVRLTSAKLRGGVAPRSDLRQAEQILEVAEGDIADLTTALAQDKNALQLLVGAPVDTRLLPASIERAFPTIAAVPAGIDSGILLRRPDVVQAEYALRASNAEIGAARAALFPRITLTGALGFASPALSSLFTDGAFNSSVAPSIGYSIFRAGAGRATLRASRAQRDAALAAYERAIQSAFRETADALARQGTFEAQFGASRRNEQAASDTFTLANVRYRGGVETFLASLDAQRSLYTARRTLVATELLGATNKVALYRALGGDASLSNQADR